MINPVNLVAARITYFGRGCGHRHSSPRAKLEVFHKFSTATHTTLPIDSDNISSNETVGLFLSKQPHDVSTFRYGLAMGTLSNGNSYIQSLSSDNSGRKLLLNPNVVGYVGIGTSNPEYRFSGFYLQKYVYQWNIVDGSGSRIGWGDYFPLPCITNFTLTSSQNIGPISIKVHTGYGGMDYCK